MKKLGWITGLLLALLLSGNQIFAQNTVTQDKQPEKLTKADKKKLKQVEAMKQWENMLQLIKTKQFVFEANYLSTPNGSGSIDPTTNFFYVIGDDAVIQFSFSFLENRQMQNGIGGLTVKGKAVKYDYSADTYKKPITVNVSMRPVNGTVSGIQQLDLTVYGDGTAELQLSSNGARMNGVVKAPQDSKVYQGLTRKVY